MERRFEKGRRLSWSSMCHVPFQNYARKHTSRGRRWRSISLGWMVTQTLKDSFCQNKRTTHVDFESPTDRPRCLLETNLITQKSLDWVNILEDGMFRGWCDIKERVICMKKYRKIRGKVIQNVPYILLIKRPCNPVHSLKKFWAEVWWRCQRVTRDWSRL